MKINKDTKALYWSIAFGLQEVDNLTPSRYMQKLVKEHINGQKNYYEVQENLKTYYANSININEDEEEADEASYAIYGILSNGAFHFDYLTYKNYHKRLFKNLSKEKYNPGEFRTYNFTKKETILNNDSVNYQAYDLIEETLKYDFEEEKNTKYINMSQKDLIEHLALFTSKIWQVHPFSKGNTRTTAIFIQKYLLSMGFNVHNDLFKDNSLYFRNALVRANYTNYQKGIDNDYKYLIMFFENLLFNTKHILNNEDLNI